MKKRLLALAVALFTTLAMLPVSVLPAFAEPGTQPPVIDLSTLKVELPLAEGVEKTEANPDDIVKISVMVTDDHDITSVFFRLVSPGGMPYDCPASYNPATGLYEYEFLVKDKNKKQGEWKVQTLTATDVDGNTASVESTAVFNVGFTKDELGSKTAAPFSLNPRERVTKVTLKVPAEEKRKVDVVFVVDRSGSTRNAGVNFNTPAMRILNELKDSEYNINVGIIKFGGSAVDAISRVTGGSLSELTPLNDETEEFVDNAMNATISETYANYGTNLHAGLILAEKWLKDDNEASDKDKYIVVLTDGKENMWGDEEGNIYSIYSQWYFTNNNYRFHGIQAPGTNIFGNFWIGKGYGYPEYNQHAGRNKYDYRVGINTADQPIIWFNSFKDLYNANATMGSKASQVASAEFNGTGPFDMKIQADYDERYSGLGARSQGDVVRHDVTNGTSINIPGAGTNHDYKYWYEFQPRVSGLKWQEGNPYDVIDNQDGTYTFDFSVPNPNFYMYHVSGLEKSVYLAAHKYAELSEKYHTAAVADTTGQYQGTMMQKIAKGFCDEWLTVTKAVDAQRPDEQKVQAASEYAASKSDAGSVSAMFDSISKGIRYTIAKGTLTDQIPDEYKLVLPEGGASPFTLKLGKSGSQVEVAMTRAGYNTWDFGEMVDLDGDGTLESYPYTITFTPGAEENGGQFVMDIRVPIENSKPMEVSYDLKIDLWAERAVHDTNITAVLDYENSIGTEDTYTFEVPEVEYIYALMEYDANGGTGVQTDDNNPYVVMDPVRVLGPEEGEGTIRREGYVFTGWNTERDGSGTTYQPGDVFYIPADTIIYAQWGQIPKISVSGQKIWDDDDNRDGKRPESITVRLHRSDTAEAIDTRTVKESDDWRYSFTDLPTIVDGHEVRYSVSEDSIEDYTGIYDVSAGEYDITNTYTPGNISITVTKSWAGDTEADRPEFVTARLYKNGEKTDTAIRLEPDVNGAWQGVFEGLYEYEAGEKITYTVKEEDVPENYTSEVTGDQDMGFNIENTFIPPKTVQIKLMKTVSGDAETEKDFRFKASFTPVDMEPFEDAFTLKAGQEKVYEAVAVGTRVVIEEIGAEEYAKTYRVNGETASGFDLTAAEGADLVLALNNHKETPSTEPTTEPPTDPSTDPSTEPSTEPTTEPTKPSDTTTIETETVTSKVPNTGDELNMTGWLALGAAAVITSLLTGIYIKRRR